MCLQVGDHLLLARVVLHNLLLDLLGLDADLEHLVDDLLQVLHHVVVLALEVLIRLVNDVDEYLAVILEGTTQRFQVVVDLRKNKIIITIEVLLLVVVLTSSEN